MQLKVLGIIAGKLHLYRFFSKLGIEAFFYRLSFKDKINQSKKFFDDNFERVNTITNMFVDSFSKETFKKAVLFRQTHFIRYRPRICKEKEYFNSCIPSDNLGGGGVFIDCGAYVGDTMIDYVAWTKNKYKKIVAFEPDPNNFKLLLVNTRRDGRILCYNKGCWDRTCTLSFHSGNAAGSCIAEKGNLTGSNDCEEWISIEAVALDDIPEVYDADFIKMDIEGAELQALNGAMNIIANNRPILAICIYHSDEDMLAIPEWMMRNLRDYNFYCRHHSYYVSDTILYAVPMEKLKNI